MLGCSSLRPAALSLPTIVDREQDFELVVSDLSVSCMPDRYELTVLPLDEEKFCFIQCLPYSEEDYAAIMERAREYVVYTESEGNMSGERKKDIRCEPALKPAHILVRNGKFAGVLLTCKSVEECYMHTTRHDVCHGILFADGTELGLCQSRWDFSPGGRWHIDRFRLTAQEGWQKLLGR